MGKNERFDLEERFISFDLMIMKSVGLQLIIRKPLIKNCEILKKAEKECEELNLIISKSIITAKTNSTRNKSSKTK